ncbi:MAG: hypothetical protein IJE97_13010, partial [Thermoguttaceae bacterium]|nr:hypothetical protein [Thermoguttaceae bacterium]
MSSQHTATQNASKTRFTRRLRFAFCGALVAIFGLGGAPSSLEAAQSRVVMKDGRLYVGGVFPTQSVLAIPNQKQERESAPVKSEKIVVIDDELRRIYVSKGNILDLAPDESGTALEVFKIPQRVCNDPSKRIGILGYYRATSEFDEFGRRAILASGQTIVQGITEIAPTYVRVQGLTHNVDSRLSPHSIPRKTLSALVKKRIDPTVLDDRLRVYQFYVHATLYEQAAEELQEIIDDFQNDEANDARLDVALRLIKQLAAQRLIDELELRRAAGQHRKVKELLDSFEADRVSPEKIQAIRRMLRQYEDEAKRRAHIVERVQTLAD